MTTFSLIGLALACFLAGCLTGALAICLGICAARSDEQIHRVSETDHFDV